LIIASKLLGCCVLTASEGCVQALPLEAVTAACVAALQPAGVLGELNTARAGWAECVCHQTSVAVRRSAPTSIEPLSSSAVNVETGRSPPRSVHEDHVARFACDLSAATVQRREAGVTARRSYMPGRNQPSRREFVKCISVGSRERRTWTLCWPRHGVRRWLPAGSHHLHRGRRRRPVAHTALCYAPLYGNVAGA
jgi:hypothetical protein